MVPNAKRRVSAPGSVQSDAVRSLPGCSEQCQASQVAMCAPRQKLMWPPVSTPGDDVGPQVDIVQATRLANRPIPLPLNCGVCYIETGIRFDPEQFPDLSRKTQEKLATKIIESGRSPEHGRTIKVKEYSSKARKRIRFACSRDECSVTFQINFDSKGVTGFWFMKRNKGNFEHTCSALRTVTQLPDASSTSPVENKTPQLFAEPVTTLPPQLLCHVKPPGALAHPPTIVRSTSLPLKRASPEVNPLQTPNSLKKPKTLTRASQKAQSETLSTEQERKDWPACSYSPRYYVDESKRETPKTRNGVAKAIKIIKNTQDFPLSTPNLVVKKPQDSVLVSNPLAPLTPLKPAIRKDEDPKPVKRQHPSPSSVAVIIYSQEPSPIDYVFKAKKQNSLPSSNQSEDVFWSVPPSPVKVVSPAIPADQYAPMSSKQGVSFFHENPPQPQGKKPHVDPCGAEPVPEAAGIMVETRTETSALPPLMAASHASLLEEELHDIDYCMGPGLAPPEESFVGTSGASEAGSSHGDFRNDHVEEVLSHKLSLCSLLVSPLDLVNLDCWEKTTTPNLGKDDDDSSISTNWSAMDFKS